VSWQVVVNHHHNVVICRIVKAILSVVVGLGVACLHANTRLGHVISLRLQQQRCSGSVGTSR